MASLLVALFMVLPLTMATVIPVSIHTDHVIQEVDERFLSITIDQSVLAYPKWLHFNFSSPRLHTLMSALAPAYLRFGGTSADYAVFTKEDPVILTKIGLTPSMTQMSPEDWDNLVGLARRTGVRLMYEFNLQLRYGQQWDPSSAIQTLTYLHQQGYTDTVDFQLGNEPDQYPYIHGFEAVNGSRIGDDYVILAKLLKLYPAFNNSIIVGPDTGGLPKDLLQGFIKQAGDVISAVTIHHYYFRGPGASYKDYINSTHFETFHKHLEEALSIVHGSAAPHLPIWLDETSDAYNAGTPNVSDRYVSGFLWLDKLGLSASMGIKLVGRQTFWYGNYGLTDINFNPNPDYWLSLLFQQLVGRRVLEVEQSNLLHDHGYSERLQSVRVYAHCATERASNVAGAVTVYTLSVNTTETTTLMFSGSLGNQEVDLYLMTPNGPDGLLSKYVALNGERLEMTSEHSLPTLKPVRVKATPGIKLPPLSYAFIIFPDASAPACM